MLANLIAVRLRFTALTGLPLLMLPSVPVMVNAGHDLFVTGLVFCLGAAGYLATLAAAGRASADAAALAMAVPVGLTGIALALCSPLLLPAVSLGQLFSVGASTGTLTQTMAQLHESRPTVVFSYTTSAPPRLQRSDPQYFQQYVFDTLDDAGSPTARTAADPAQPRAGLLLRSPSRTRASGPHREGSLAGHWARSSQKARTWSQVEGADLEGPGARCSARSTGGTAP